MGGGKNQGAGFCFCNKNTINTHRSDLTTIFSSGLCSHPLQITLFSLLSPSLLYSYSHIYPLGTYTPSLCPIRASCSMSCGFYPSIGIVMPINVHLMKAPPQKSLLRMFQYLRLPFTRRSDNLSHYSLCN